MEQIHAPRIVLCDIDGTIANNDHRIHYIEQTVPDWDKFFKAAVDDTPYQDIIDMLWALESAGATIEYISGRPERIRKITRNWLVDHACPSGNIRMRGDTDHRPDYQTKLDLVKDLPPRKVWLWIDDRKQVVDMTRLHGYRVLQVANGDF